MDFCVCAYVHECVCVSKVHIHVDELLSAEQLCLMSKRYLAASSLPFICKAYVKIINPLILQK